MDEMEVVEPLLSGARIGIVNLIGGRVRARVRVRVRVWVRVWVRVRVRVRVRGGLG